MRQLRRYGRRLALLTFVCAVGIWIGCGTLSDDRPLFGYRGEGDGVRHDSGHVSLTPYRAVEIVYVQGSILLEDRRSGYYQLRRRPAVWGAYVGAVPVGGGAFSAFVILIPLWAVVAAASIWPAVLWWRRLRPERRGFPVAVGIE